MELTANLRPRISLSTVIRIKRSLAGEGKLTITKGQEVEPDDILGSYQLSAGFSTVNLAKELGVSKEAGGDYLKRKKGEVIYKGELLALKTSLLGKRQVVAPTDALIDEYSPTTGELLLKFVPKRLQLTAGVYGIVDEVRNSSGEVFIKTLVNEIFGICGSGKERSGILELIDGKGHLTTKNQVTRDMKGRIVLTGALIYKEALNQAIEYGIAGVISGGLNAKDYIAIAGSVNAFNRVGTDVGLTVIVTEGFGPIPIGDDIFALIQNYLGKYVFTYGNSAKLVLPVQNEDIIITLRKTILPPVARSPERQPELLVKEIKIGSKVRIIWPPFVGSQGKVIGIDKSVSTLTSGISTILLTIETPLRKLKIPFTNIELI
ncbi:hypothetical protein HY025_05250 [Candidatus Daviesbacteria bacterium]|nr:hypothetical protein [Candidatus Daviesbacteria bacterium]